MVFRAAKKWKMPLSHSWLRHLKRKYSKRHTKYVFAFILIKNFHSFSNMKAASVITNSFCAAKPCWNPQNLTLNCNKDPKDIKYIRMKYHIASMRNWTKLIQNKWDRVLISCGNKRGNLGVADNQISYNLHVWMIGQVQKMTYCLTLLGKLMNIFLKFSSFIWIISRWGYFLLFLITLSFCYLVMLSTLWSIC